MLLLLAFAQGVLHAVASELLVVVNEGEREVDVERVGPVRGCCPLPRLKGNHEVHPGSRPLNLKLVDEVLAKDLTQELLKLIVNSKRTVGTTWRDGRTVTLAECEKRMFKSSNLRLCKAP